MKVLTSSWPSTTVLAHLSGPSGRAGRAFCRDRSRPSGRDWARQLGISHTWLQKLVRKFAADPGEMRRIEAAWGQPRFSELARAQEETLRMREIGRLRSSRQPKW